MAHKLLPHGLKRLIRVTLSLPFRSSNVDPDVRMGCCYGLAFEEIAWVIIV